MWEKYGLIALTAEVARFIQYIANTPGRAHGHIKGAAMGKKYDEFAGKAIGCEYCLEYENGDVSGEPLVLLKFFVKRKSLIDKIRAFVDITHNELNLCITDEDGGESLEMYSSDGESIDDIGFLEKPIKIKYCPMCGRKLVERKTPDGKETG